MMKSKKEQAYNKLFKYVNKKYPDDDIQWDTDIEGDDSYIMRAILPNKTQKRISVDYQSMKILEVEF